MWSLGRRNGGIRTRAVRLTDQRLGSTHLLDSLARSGAELATRPQRRAITNDAGKVKSKGGAHRAYVYIHHIRPAKGKGQKVQGKLFEGTYFVHRTQHSGPLIKLLSGHQALLAVPGKDPALALSLAGFGRMTAWRQGSFVKAAAHFLRGPPRV